MWDKCVIHLNKDVYYPGQTLTGKVEIHLRSDKRVRAIKVNIHGQANVRIFDDQKHQPSTQTYVDYETDLMPKPESSDRDTILVHTGVHPYKFSYELPRDIPSSMSSKMGNIVYEINAEIDLPGSIALTDTKTFTVGSIVDLNSLPLSTRNPIVKTEVNDIIFLCFRTDPLSIRVELPVRAYIPSQLVSFKCIVRNRSRLNVLKVSFKILQVFDFFAMAREERKEMELNKIYVQDSAVRSGTDKAFHVELKIPSNTVAPNLTGCSMMKMHCELVGKVVLPYPHFDLIITIPFALGTVPFKPLPTTPTRPTIMKHRRSIY